MGANAREHPIRRHESIRATKVKGHATDAMIEAGVERPADKDGNDWADSAAGKGTCKYSEVATMARKYSIRNARYRGLMTQIHHFIVNMLKAHKEELLISKKKTNPVGNAAMDKQKVAKRLSFEYYVKCDLQPGPVPQSNTSQGKWYQQDASMPSGIFTTNATSDDAPLEAKAGRIKHAKLPQHIATEDTSTQAGRGRGFLHALAMARHQRRATPRRRMSDTAGTIRTLSQTRW